MNNLTPTYRIVLNKNLLKFPQFIWFLKQEFHRQITNVIIQQNIDLEEVYKFTLLFVPVQWGNYIINKIKLNESLPEDKQDKKLVRLGDILHQLDPLNPQPVDIEFKLGDIIQFVLSNVKYYQEVTPGGVQDYFGIETQLWFDDFPIQTGTVLKAVDYGTRSNKPKYLFNAVFNVMRNTLMDLFKLFIKFVKENKLDNQVVVKDVNI